MRVLLVDDDERLADAVKNGIEKKGFCVDVVLNGESAKAAFATVSYDAVILDLGLPDQDGIGLLREWRESGDETPVLILTARDAVDDRVHGLNSGSDDYLLKPFDMGELIARIRALLRRPGGALGLVLITGNVLFDTTAREVRVNDKTITFSHRQLEILEHLMRCTGRVVPKDVLEDMIYGTDEKVASNAVEVHVSRLRKLLSNAHANVSIHTVRGVGYLLSEETA